MIRGVIRSYTYNLRNKTARSHDAFCSYFVVITHDFQIKVGAALELNRASSKVFIIKL